VGQALTVRGTRICACAIVGAAILAGAAGGSGWSDRYQWRYYGGLQSTVDGGKHWRTMVSLGYFEPTWMQLGPRSGFVYASDGDEQAQPYWTVDDGLHWYHAPGMDAPYVGTDWPPDTFQIAWTSRELFYEFSQFSYDDVQPFFDLYQVRPWPPTPAALACRRWGRRAAFHGKVCDEPRATLQGVRVAHVPGVAHDGFHFVPGGIGALVLATDPTQPLARLYLRRNGRGKLLTIPVGDDLRVAAARAGADGIMRINWPNIDVVVWVRHGPAEHWLTTDGGDDWEEY
jgi:hypothetical protein